MPLNSKNSREDLRQAIARAQHVDADKNTSTPAVGAGMAWRVSAELIAGVMVGLGIGYGADKAFGSDPFGMIIGLMLGTAGAIFNIQRVVLQLQKREEDASRAQQEQKE
jgi:ATP synthase protein I